MRALTAQCGQTAAEYLGVLLVASAIIAAIVSTDLPGELRDAAARQVCLIAGEAGDCGPSSAKAHSRAKSKRQHAATRRSAGEPVRARAAAVACDGMTAKECSALRAMMNRAAAEYQQAREDYLRYAADFATWVAGVEKIKNVRDVVYRPGIFNAVNRLLRREINREGARLLTAVRNKPLENLIVSNYRYGAKYGKGSTADGVKNDIATGVAWGAPKSHYIKAVQSIKRLNKILTRETLSAREKQIATNIRQELWDALPPHRRPRLR